MSGVEFNKSAIGDQSDAALRELLLRRGHETQDSNARYEQLADMMRADAHTFADTMRTLGAAHDVAHNYVTVRPATFFKTAETRRDEYPLWVIGNANKYGGGTYDYKDRYSRRLMAPDPRRLVITGVGELALIYVRFGLDYRPDSPALRTEELLDREAGETQETAEAVRITWQDDLVEASRVYTRKPFIPYYQRLERSLST